MTTVNEKEKKAENPVFLGYSRKNKYIWIIWGNATLSVIHDPELVHGSLTLLSATPLMLGDRLFQKQMA